MVSLGDRSSHIQGKAPHQVKIYREVNTSWGESPLLVQKSERKSPFVKLAQSALPLERLSSHAFSFVFFFENP